MPAVVRTIPPVWALALSLALGALVAYRGPAWLDPLALLLAVISCLAGARGLRWLAGRWSMGSSRGRLVLVTAGLLLMVAWALTSALWASGRGADRLASRPELSSKGEQVWARLQIRGLSAEQTGFKGQTQQRVLVAVGPAWTEQGLRWEEPSLFQISLPRRSPPKPGEVWLAQLKLAPPLGLRNAGGFDAESWAFQADLAGQGRVVMDKGRPLMVRQGEQQDFWTWIERQRLAIRSVIQQALPDGRYVGVMTGLVVGDQKGIIPVD